jgi:hypothetical protein
MQTINTLILVNTALTIALFFVVDSKRTSVVLVALLLALAVVMRWASRNKGSAAKAITTTYVIANTVSLIIFVTPKFEAFVGFARVMMAVVLGLVFLGAGRAYSITAKVPFPISIKSQASISKLTGRLQFGGGV